MAIAEPPAAQTPPRSWRKLHASNWLAVILCLAVLLLANLSGYVCWEWERQETGKPYAWHHGWPWTFLQRDGAPDPVFGSPTFDRDLWALNRRVLDVDPLALVGNVAVGLGLTVLIAGGLEWRRRRRSRLLQLTISDLAGVTFVVAAVLGYGTWRYRNWERQAEALRHLHETDDSELVHIFLGFEASQGSPAWAHPRLPGDEFCPFDRVSHLYIDRQSIELNRLNAFRDLESLYLTLSELPDTRSFQGLPDLRELELGGRGINDSTLEQFADCRKLRSLAIFDSTVQSLTHLRGMAALESLSIELSDRNDPDIETSETWAWLATLTRLQSLDLRPASDLALEHIGSLPSLADLSLSETGVTDLGIAKLRNFASLNGLDLRKTAVGDAGMPAIARLENLHHLFLDATLVGDEGLRHLAGLTKMYELTLNDTRVSDAGLVHLEGLPNLKFLELQRTEVSEAAVNRLRAKLPNAVVVFTPKTPP